MAGSSPWVLGPYQGVNVVFCFCQVRRLAVASAGWALVLENPGCWAHAQPASLQYGHFVHGPIEQALGWLGKEAGWHPQSAPFYPPDYWVSSTVGTFNVHSDRTQISSQSVTIQRNPFIYLFPILPHLQSSNPIPSRKTISNCPFWSSLTPDMVNKQIYYLSYAHLEDFPSPLTVLQTPEWG